MKTKHIRKPFAQVNLPSQIQCVLKDFLICSAEKNVFVAFFKFWDFFVSI